MDTKICSLPRTQTFFDSSLRASDFHITFCLSAVLPFFLLWTTCGNITTLLTDTSSAQGDVRMMKKTAEEEEEEEGFLQGFQQAVNQPSYLT